MANNFKPKMVTIHCSVTPNGKYVPVEEMRKWHIERGWSDIGYHILINPVGPVMGEENRGRPLNKTGAHVEDKNKDNVGICMIGTDRFTQGQFSILRSCLDYLCRMFDVEPWEIYCHYELDKKGKTCPNMDIRRILRWYYSHDIDAIRPYLIKDALF